jgi:hypothetical protein
MAAEDTAVMAAVGTAAMLEVTATVSAMDTTLLVMGTVTAAAGE